MLRRRLRLRGGRSADPSAAGVEGVGAEASPGRTRRHPRPADRCACGCGSGCVSAGGARWSRPWSPRRRPDLRAAARGAGATAAGGAAGTAGAAGPTACAAGGAGAAPRLDRRPRRLHRRSDAALGVLGDPEVVEEVLGGRVGLGQLLEGQAQRLVDDLPARHVRPVDEGDRDAGGAGATGATDPVHVRRVVLRTVVVDDVRDVLDVDAAGGDIGGHEHAHLALAELGHRLLARDLRHVAVQRRGREPALGEVVGHALRLALGAGEADGDPEFSDWRMRASISTLSRSCTW